MLYRSHMVRRNKAEAELQLLRGQRDRVVAEVAAVERQIGVVAAAALEEPYASYSSLARVLGVSHTHVKTLVERASSREPCQEESDWRTPILSPSAARHYLEETGRSIRRIVAGFAESDVLYASRQDPHVYTSGDGVTVSVPNMVWQLDDGNWVGIDDVSVGYGGTGPSNAYALLGSVGLDEGLASRVAGHRYSDVQLPDGPAMHRVEWPLYNLALPAPDGDALVVILSHGSWEPTEPSPDPSGFYPSEDGRSSLDYWLDFLNSDPPPWAAGSRRARVFLSRSAAVDQGFFTQQYGSRRASSVPNIVIEQGTLQLWLMTHRPHDTTQYLAPEEYAVLTMCGLYPDELAHHDARSAFWRYLNKRVNQQPPEFVDISDTGREALANLPSAAHLESPFRASALPRPISS